jgi:hypothetical protein
MPKYLGSLRVSRQGKGRFYVVVPPLPIVRNLAGTRKLDFTAIPIIPASCDSGTLSDVEISFSAKITFVKRHDGSAWFKVNLPLKFNDVWSAVHKCGGSVKLVLNV